MIAEIQESLAPTQELAVREETRTAKSRTGRGCLLAGVALVCIFVAMKVVLGAGPVDDTFIFLRYAENLAKGLGPVFNPGDRVEGYTSPLWVLCLSFFAILHLDLVVVAQALSAFLAGVTILLLFNDAARRLPAYAWPLATVPAVLLATSPAFDYWAWSGLDTALFTLLVVSTFLLFVRQAPGTGNLLGTGLLFSLSILCRYEAVVLLPVYLAFIFYMNRTRPGVLPRKYLSFGLPLLLPLLHLVWRHSYYGSWLPNTFYAKVGVPFSVLITNGVAYTRDFALAHLPVLMVIAGVFIVAKPAWSRLNESKLALLLLAVWACYVSWVGGDHFAMFRFYVPVLPLLAIVLVDVLRLFAARLERLRPAEVTVVVACSLLVAGLSSYYTYQPFGGQTARDEVGLAKDWSEVGLWLKRNVPSNSTLASMVVGAIPYYSGMKTYDLLGLTDREIATKGKVYVEGAIGHQKYDTEYILAQRPDYIILPWSGLYTEIKDPSPDEVPQYYYHSIYDLFSNPKTAQMYDFKAAAMNNGRYIDYLQLKAP